MNQPQRYVLVLALVGIAFMGLFPPFLMIAVNRIEPAIRPLETAGHYGCLLAPPAPYSDGDWSVSFRVDAPRLCVQWAVLCSVTAALLLLLRREPAATPSEAPALRPDSSPPSAAAAPHSRSAPASSEAIRSAPR